MSARQILRCPDANSKNRYVKSLTEDLANSIVGWDVYPGLRRGIGGSRAVRRAALFDVFVLACSLL
jgi:hypothetical protein